MCPEIIRGEVCSEKVDIWSFGIVFWEILTRQSPFQGLDPMALIFQIGSQHLHPPIPSGCPKVFSSIMAQCWASVPRDRPSFAQILQLLRTAQQQLSNRDLNAPIGPRQLLWQQETMDAYRAKGLDTSAVQRGPNRATTAEELKAQFAGLFRIINESATKVWEAAVSFLEEIPEKMVHQMKQDCSKRPSPKMRSDSTSAPLSPSPTQEGSRTPPPSKVSANLPRETKGAVIMNFASIRAGPERGTGRPDLRQEMMEASKRGVEPRLLAFMIKIAEIYVKAGDSLLEQFKEWKKTHRGDARFSTTFDEVLVRLQNQVTRDTALARVKEFARHHLDKALFRLQAFHLTVESAIVQDLLRQSLSTRFALKAFSKEIMSLTIDVIELDLLRIHFAILDAST